MKGTNRREAESRLAVRVLEACRNQLFLRQRFLEQALFRLKWEETEEISVGNDGEHLYYDSKYILKRYTQGPEQVTLDYLHTVMHCLYQHLFLGLRDRLKGEEACWNLAADIAVECVLGEMEESAVSEDGAMQRSEILQKLKGEISFMSAQKIFSYLHKKAVRERAESIFGMDFQGLCGLFKRDEHALWYTGRSAGESADSQLSLRHTQHGCGHIFTEERVRLEEDGKENRQEEPLESNEQEEPPESCEQEKPPEEQEDNRVENLSRDKMKTEDSGRENLQQIWKNVAERVLVEAQAYTHSGRGEITGSMLQNLKKVTRETYDYTQFLMKFASHREERMQIDEDEFDYAFYTYGMKLYGKVPLIEPLEYKEKNLIREFLIAIDTSGSCQGEAVEGFLTKTYNILRQAQAFTTRVNIHIVQCDACIQEDARIGSQEELEVYIAGLTLKGFGGTDFTPVFEYADRLLETGEIRRLDGLLYFTDGYGIFPARPPGYRTAFVFLDKAEEVRVPPWAMKVYLDSE